MSNIARDHDMPAKEEDLPEDGVQPASGHEPHVHSGEMATHDDAYQSPGQAHGGAFDSHDQMAGGAYPPPEMTAGGAYPAQQPMGQDQGFADPAQGGMAHEQDYADPAHQGGQVENPMMPAAQEYAPDLSLAAQSMEMGGEQAPPVASIASPDEDWIPPESAAQPITAQGPASAADVSAKPLPRINIQAFCEDQNTAVLLQTASQDRRLSKTHVSVQMGGLEAAAHYYRNAPTPNLIIVESMHDPDAMVLDIDRLSSVCDSGTKVIVIGHVNDVLLYRKLLQLGVSEYLVSPLSVAQLMNSLSSLYNDPSSDPLGRVLAFVGAKGGVGSSTVCHNTAWAISQSIKTDVVIADLDLPFGTAGLDFNQDPVQGIADALLSPERLDDVLLDRLLSRCSDHLSLFAAPGTLDRPYDLNANSCDAVMDVLRKNVPYIAMDVPHVWTEWAQRVLVQADRVIITALPDLANLRNTKNLIDKLVSARPNDLPPLLVLNQLGVPKRPEISVKDFSNAVATDPVSVIEFDTQLFGTAANNGQMIEEVSAKAKAAEQFQVLARALTDRTAAKVESKSILGPLLSKFGRGGAKKPSGKKAGKK